MRLPRDTFPSDWSALTGRGTSAPVASGDTRRDEPWAEAPSCVGFTWRCQYTFGGAGLELKLLSPRLVYLRYHFISSTVRPFLDIGHSSRPPRGAVLDHAHALKSDAHVYPMKIYDLRNAKLMKETASELFLNIIFYVHHVLVTSKVVLQNCDRRPHISGDPQNRASGSEVLLRDRVRLEAGAGARLYTDRPGQR
ncbi:hypothetical protein EVAR_102654_1 [Eumeta japonica]|uniref:Uncharacterized protein n=1 Tax=Eumeta variegata TaxID=151549 RepID=A0A4C1TUV0_EUMVA|nr:hypothetical protein EVAR_102654_1 [Eumeta japonica]